MKRLFEQIGVTYLSVLAIVFYFGTTFAFVLACVALVATAMFLAIKRFRKTVYLVVVALTTLIACTVNLVYTNAVYNSVVEKYDNTSGVVVATLTELPTKTHNSYSYNFQAESVDGEECDFNFVAYYHDDLNLEPYDKIKITVDLCKTDSKYLISKGFFIRADFGYNDISYTTIHTDDKPIKYDAIQLRQKIETMLYENLNNDSAQLCSALLVGDKNALKVECVEDFRKAGVSHLIVVSGMHFSILTALWFLLAKKLRKLRALFIGVGAAFVVFYMFITGFTPSVMRSSIMMLVYAVALLISRESYGGNSLGFAAILVISFFGPYSAGDIGLILSFACTYSIIKLSPLLYAKFSKRIIPKRDMKASWWKRSLIRIFEYFVRLLCVNICAFAASFPLSIIFFGSVSLISIVTSFVLAVPVTILMYLLIVFSLICFLPFLSFLLPLVVFLVECISQFILNLVTFCAQFEFAYVDILHNYVYLWLVLSILLVILFVAFTNRKDLRILSLCILTLFLTGQASALHFDSKVSSLSVFEAGNGTAVMYKNKNSTIMLSFDCTASKRNDIIDKLQHSVSEIDYCSSVADNLNSRNCLLNLTQVFAIDNILLYDNKRDFSFEHTCTITTPSKDYIFKFSDDTYVRYYLTEYGYVTFLNDNGYTVLLLPHLADAKLLPENMRNCDVIIVNSDIDNFELLSCDTLIISAKEDVAYPVMKMLCPISNTVLLTMDSDIKLLAEV